MRLGFFWGGGNYFVHRTHFSHVHIAQLYHLVHKAYHQGPIYMLTSKAPDNFNVHKKLILIIAAYCSSDLPAVDRFDLYI